MYVTTATYFIFHLFIYGKHYFTYTCTIADQKNEYKYKAMCEYITL